MKLLRRFLLAVAIPRNSAPPMTQKSPAETAGLFVYLES
jgi:hypothetical protein